MDNNDKGFKVGDKVVRSNGKSGVITKKNVRAVCDEGLAHIEYRVSYGDDDYEWLTRYQEHNGYKDFYQIGNTIYGNTEFSMLDNQIYILQLQLETMIRRRDYLRKLVEHDGKNEEGNERRP